MAGDSPASMSIQVAGTQAEYRQGTGGFEKGARIVIPRKCKVDVDTGCWIWTGNIDGAGYPTIRLHGHEVGVHRLMYKLFRGRIPRHHYVCHSCDTPACVNPDHLFTGTSRDNQIDRFKKVPGHPTRKRLSKEVITAIKESDERTGLIAERFNVSARHVRHLRSIP